MDAIFKRRSIRRFTDQIIPEEAIDRLLRAGMAAPSAGNEKPWHFIVVRERKNLVKLSKTHRNASMIADARAAIVICADLKLEIKKDMWVQDCSAAAENILIEVTHLGLGAVWVGVYPREDRIKYLSGALLLPPEIIPLCVIPVGYPGEEPPEVDRFDQARIHNEKW